MLDPDHTFSPTSLAVSEKSPNIIYACDRLEAKIHRSDDGGETWSSYYDFGKGHMLTSVVAIHPNDPDVIYAAAFRPPMAHGGVLAKIKDGEKIADLGSDLPRSVLDIEIDPENPDNIYVTTHIHGVFKSTNGGESWEKLDDRETGLPRTGIYDIDVDPVEPDTLYAAALCGELPDYMLSSQLENLEGKCGVYKSTDGGNQWTHILETVSEARGIDIDPLNNSNLYVADMMGGVWVSNDAGQTWRQENEGLGSISMTSVKVKDKEIYASTQGSGVYAGKINDDGSISWDKSRGNKPKARVFRVQIEVDPSNPNRIYASGYPGGLLRSDDGGIHWNDKNFLTPSIKVDDPTIQGYYSFDINDQDPENVWLGAYGKGLFVSYDGMEYDMFANGRDNTMMEKHITCVGVNPENPNDVYVGTAEGVFVTHDRGQHWEAINEGLETLDIRSMKITAIEWPPFEDDFEDGNAEDWNLDPGWSILRLEGNTVLEGIGHKWARAGSEDWRDYVFETRLKLIQGEVHVNFRQGSEGRYFIAFNEYEFALEKQFNNWSEFTNLRYVGEQHSLNRWYDLKVELKGDRIKVYVDGVLKIEYTDPDPLLAGHISFETVEDSHVYVDEVNVEIGPVDDVIYVGTGGYSVYRLDPDGWRNLGKSLGLGWWSPWERNMYQFSSILFHPTTPGKVYLGHFSSGFYVSEDNGHTWKDSSLGLGNDGIFSMTMHPHDPNIIWAGTYNGAAKSVDGGETWELKSEGMPPEQWPFTVAIDDENPNTMYVSTKNGQNKGLSHRNEFHGVLMKSTDGGENWFKIMEGLDEKSEFYKIIIYPLNHDTLFLSTNNGVFLSNDAGNSWEAINGGLPRIYNQVRNNVAENLALTPDNRYLFLGLSQHGVWKADIEVAMNRIPSASFTYSPIEPTVKDAVDFHDSSIDLDGSIASWNWNFGDGSTSTERNPIHIYTDKGDYAIELTVTDDDGNVNKFKRTLTVINLSPIVDFDFSPSEPKRYRDVRFTDTSEDPEGKTLSYYWSFGDEHTSVKQNPTHIYEASGNYTVTLTVTDDEGASETKTLIILIVNVSPTAAFTHSDRPTIDVDVQFTDVSTDPEGRLTSWSWEFGDGSTSIEQNPKHRFAKEGTHIVTLTVTDDEGDTDTTSKSLSVTSAETFLVTPLGIAVITGAVAALIGITFIIVKRKRLRMVKDAS